MPTNKELSRDLDGLKQTVADLASAVTELIRSQQAPPKRVQLSDDGSDMTEADAQMAALISQNQADPSNQAIIMALEKLAARGESNLYKRSAKPLRVTQKFTPENYSLKQATLELCEKNGWEMIRNSWRQLRDEQFAFQCRVTSPFHKGSMPVVARWKYNEALDYWTPVIGVSPSSKQHIQNKAFAGSKQLNLRPGQRAQDITASQARSMREGDDQYDDDGDHEVAESSFSADRV